MCRSAVLDHRLRTRKSILVDQVFLEAARIDADPHRHPLVACLADDLLESLVAADISGIDPDLIDRGAAERSHGVQARQRHPVVVVDVGDQGDRDPVADQLGRFDVLFLGYGHAHDLTTRLLEPMDLVQRRLGVEGIGGCHRLHPDRLITTDDVIANTHLARLVPLYRRRVGHRSPSSCPQNQPFTPVWLASNA